MSPKRTLEKLKYKILPPVGPGSFSTEGSVADLLMDIPYFFIAKIIPPIDVVNEVLQKGVLDAGMSGGCKWKAYLGFPSRSHVIEQRHEPEIHVQLLVAMKQRQSGIVRREVDLNFLIAAHHDDILHHARQGFPRNFGDFEAVPV
jgi:hypothetical protein